MIYSVDFKELAEKIRYIDTVKYLHDLGWNEIPTKREWVKIFQHEDQDNFYQIDLPVSRNLRDYKAAIYRAVECIALSTKKSIEQVVLELLNPLSDILRLRVNEPEIEAGSIYVEDTIKLYDNAKKLLMATAMDIVHPQLFHFGRPENAIMEFINSCRFGQTEIGSYVVSLICPISKIENNKVNQLSLFSNEEECSQSLTRKVVNKLINSIKTVRETINNRTFEEYIYKNAETENCISVNFLDALSEININRSGSELDIIAKYAPTIKNNTLSSPSITISNDYYLPINTITKEYKNTKISEKSYFGRIKRLDARPDLQNRKNGIIKFVFLDDNNSNATASVVLSKEDYNSAIDAHRDGKMIKIVGTLSGKTHKKIDCAYFELIE